MDYLDEEYIDPFEARIQFTEILNKLTASQKSVTDAAIFAMKNRKSYELIYEIIRKFISNQPVQARLNIFHVIDCICRYSIKLDFEEYLELIKKDLSSIIKDITPENDAKGDANVKPVRKVLKGWKDKNFFSEEILKTIYEKLYKREQNFEEKHKAKQRAKNEVTKRMEEDRVKQKKRKENAWILTPEMDEFSIYWNSLPLYSKSDCEDIINENKIFYHGEFPDINEEDILKILNVNEIEQKLRSKPIVYNNNENFEDKLYHKNKGFDKNIELSKRYNESYYNNKEYEYHSPNKRIRIEREKEISFNNNSKNNIKDDKINKDIHDYDRTYNRNYERSKDKNREYDQDSRNSKNDRNNKYNNDIDNKYDKESIYSSYSIHKLRKKTRIFIWDLDETLILFKSLLDKSCPEIKPEDTKLGVIAAEKMMRWIFDISENYFHYKDIEEIADPSNLEIDDIIPFDKDLRNYPFNKDNIKNEPKDSKILLKLLSYRYKDIKNKYDSNSFRDNIKDVNLIDKVYNDIDYLSHKWLSFMLSLLDGVKLSGSHGKAADCVLVSAGHLIPTLAKCVLFKLSNIFTSDKVWSSSKNGKDWCFKEIKKKYGNSYEYIVVGNSEEEGIASQKNGWPFFKIKDKRSLIEFNKLYIDS